MDDPDLLPVESVTLHLPFTVADYVDFYASEHHATNLGRILRPGQEPLQPNWRHQPVGYHGRAGTVVVSGTPVVRPCGPVEVDGEVTVRATTRLDIEAELGFVVGRPSERGTPVAIEAFADHVFGVVVVNDWSARDIQAWEAAPLGPFLGKSFQTSISPWVVPMEALEAARLPAGSAGGAGQR
jgi:fumarylacetoacetase